MFQENCSDVLKLEKLLNSLHIELLVKTKEIHRLMESSDRSKAKNAEVEAIERSLLDAQAELKNSELKLAKYKARISDGEAEIEKLENDITDMQCEKAFLVEECKMQLQLAEQDHASKTASQIQEEKSKHARDMEKIKSEHSAALKYMQKDMASREEKLLQTTKDLRSRLVLAEEKAMVHKQRSKHQHDQKQVEFAERVKSCDDSCKEKLQDMKAIFTAKVTC